VSVERQVLALAFKHHIGVANIFDGMVDGI